MNSRKLVLRAINDASVANEAIWEGNFAQFWLIFVHICCRGNSLGSLENLNSIFEITDPENPTIHAKYVSISCTEMKLCLFECLAHLYHCGYRHFSRFFAKNSRTCLKFLIKPQISTRIYGNTSYEPLTTFLFYDVRCDLCR